MSDVIEKTLSLFSDGLRGSSGDKNAGVTPKKLMGRSFHGFIRTVCRSQNRKEEQTFVTHELSQIKDSLSRTDVSLDSVCDYLCRLVFCHMMGYDVSFGLINTLKLAQQGSGLEKRIGYVTATLLLHRDHELILLLMNTIQKDLNSTNILDNCFALTAICHLVSSDVGVMSMMLPSVMKKLEHPRELVRMKAACCILRYIRITPSYQRHLQDASRKLLYDKDPGVMSIGVKIQLELLRGGNQNSQNLTSDLSSILQQIMNRSLPSSFEYHGIPLPWLQIDILRALSILGRGNKKDSEHIYPLLKDLLDKINMRERMAFALMYECIVTITSIAPHRGLLNEASVRVKKFISSTSYALKYIGVKALTHLIAVSPESTTDCQMIVVELLDDPDPAIQSKTVDLLYSMANESNVKIVCSKLVQHLDRPGNDFTKTELIRKIITLTEQYRLDGIWAFDVVLMVLKVERNYLPENLVDRILNNLTKILELPVQTSQVPETLQHIVKKSLQGLFQENCSKELVKITAWVLSEHSSLLKNMPEDKIMSLLQKQFLRQTLDTSTRLWILSCMTGLLCGGVLKPGVVKEAVRKLQDTDTYTREIDFTLQQKLVECERLCDSPVMLDLQTRQADTSQLDFTLSFLDDFVSDALEDGAKPYIHSSLRVPSVKDPLFSGYGKSRVCSESLQSSSSGKLTVPGTSSKTTASDSKNINLKLEGISKVWGEEGFLEKETKVEVGLDSASAEKQRELEEKKELAAALFSGFSSGSKVGDEEAELHDPWAEEVPLTLNSNSTDWRALSAEESCKGEKSDDKMKTNSNLIDLSEPEKSSENLFSSETVPSAAELNMEGGVDKLDLGVDKLNLGVDKINIVVDEINLGVDEHRMGADEHDMGDDKHDRDEQHPVTQLCQGKMEFYSREPPPLCGEDFSEDTTAEVNNQPFSGSYEVMGGGSYEVMGGDENLIDIHESLCSDSHLNFDVSRLKLEERDDSGLCMKAESSFDSEQSEDKEDLPRQDEQHEGSLYSQYRTLSDSEESEHS